MLLAVASILIWCSSAQSSLKAQILSTVVYTRYGDRTPFIYASNPALTPLGAQQLYQAGAKFRSRYLVPVLDITTPDTTIRDISTWQLHHDEIDILTTDDQYVVASAQVFMQGLYPPLETFSNHSSVANSYELANGSNLVAPLGGFQYPNILTASGNDINSIWLAGQENCPAWSALTTDCYSSSAFQEFQANTQSFYRGLQPNLLNGVFPDTSVGYFDAYYIWDYLNYAYTHNSSVADLLAPEDLTRAKVLADDWVFALNANLTASGRSAGDHVGVIAGRTLASRVLQAFYTAINTQGQSDKMTLLFGSFETMVSFAALSELMSPHNGDFYNVPGAGSSFVFELFALEAEVTNTYPSTSDLYVRFLYQNGTDEDSSLVEYSLFGRSPSQSMMALQEFISAMENIMIFNIGDWCSTCDSFSVFCPAFENVNTGSPGSSLVSGAQRGMQPVVAGVVGAVVALAVFALVIAGLLLLCGIRLQRRSGRRQSDLGGFKGAEKLASDQDLTMSKSRAGVSIVDSGAIHAPAKERVGSWELKDQAKTRNEQSPVLHVGNTRSSRKPSFEEDEIEAEPVKPYDYV